MPFGKYRGRELREIIADDDYVHFLRGNHHWAVQAVPELLVDLENLTADLRQEEEAESDNVVRLPSRTAR